VNDRMGSGAASGASAWLDRAGCLTSAGVQAIASAPAGQAPAVLAVHLASCVRCQESLLAADRPAGEPRTRAEAPPPWRIGVVLVAALLLLVSVLWTIHWLTGS